MNTMLDKIFLEFDIDIMKANHIYEVASNAFDIKMNELMILESQGYFESGEDSDNMFMEDANKFLDSVKEFFKNLRDAISSLFMKLMDGLKLKMEEHEVNKKIKDAKKNLAEIKASGNDKKVKFFDTAKYMRNYTKFTNEYVKSIKELYSKEYKDLVEYENSMKRVEDKLEKLYKELDLDNEEAYIIMMNATNVVSFSDKELNNIEKLTRMLKDKALEEMNQMENLTDKEDDKAKIGHIKRFASKLSSVGSKGLRFIYRNAGTIISTIAYAYAFGNLTGSPQVAVAAGAARAGLGVYAKYKMPIVLKNKEEYNKAIDEINKEIKLMKTDLSNYDPDKIKKLESRRDELKDYYQKNKFKNIEKIATKEERKNNKKYKYKK